MRLRALVRLDLRNNPLEELPEDIGMMESLTHLDLRWTKLQTLPPWLDALRKRGCRVLL